MPLISLFFVPFFIKIKHFFLFIMNEIWYQQIIDCYYLILILLLLLPHSIDYEEPNED